MQFKHKNTRKQILAMIMMILVPLAALPSIWISVQANAGQSIVVKPTKDLRAAILFPMRMVKNNATGLVEAVRYNATLYNGTRLVVDPGLYSRPYIGGYMTSNGCQPSNYCTANEAKAAISFPSTSPPVIPSGNFLEGTMNLKGADNTYAGIDYAIRAAHVLYPDGAHGVVADMWKTCEGALFGCDGLYGYATELTAFILKIYGLSAGQVIYVRIQATSGPINWLYSYDGNTWTQYYSYTPPSTFIHVLYIGTNSIVSPPYYTAFYYQFGVWAQSSFTGTFNVKFQNPSYYRNGAWSAIPTAESIYGPHTYFDQTWTYSTTQWLLNANYPNPSPTVTFYWSSCCHLPENVHLWG